jgi:NAD(P)-dependent dehydrogenase (short-subunit alcohol dehydrogenase family)
VRAQASAAPSPAATPPKALQRSLPIFVESPIEGGPSTVELITGSGGSALYLPTDISDWRAVDALVAAAVGRFGRLDIMVNNAATYTSTNLIETTPEQWSRVMAVNVTGFFYCSKRAVMQMLTQPPVDDVRGRIINISSQHGMVACPGDFPYSVSKGAIVQMTRQIAVDHAKDGIVCNAIAPGKIITGKPGIANNPDALDYSRRRTPWPRLGTPDDVAGAAVFPRQRHGELHHRCQPHGRWAVGWPGEIAPRFKALRCRSPGGGA